MKIGLSAHDYALMDSNGFNMDKYEVFTHVKSDNMEALKAMELYPLIDRLQKCSEIKYPNQKWSNEFYSLDAVTPKSGGVR